MNRYKVEKEIVAVLLNKKQINSVLSAALDTLRKEQAKRYGPWKHDSFWESICEQLIEARKEPGVVPEDCRVRATSGNEVVTILFNRRQVDRLFSSVGDRVEIVKERNKSYLVRQESMVKEEKHWDDIWEIIYDAGKTPAVAA
jgi:hypothetical protein